MKIFSYLAPRPNQSSGSNVHYKDECLKQLCPGNLQTPNLKHPNFKVTISSLYSCNLPTLKSLPHTWYINLASISRNTICFIWVQTATVLHQDTGNVLLLLSFCFMLIVESTQESSPSDSRQDWWPTSPQVQISHHHWSCFWSLITRPLILGQWHSP